MADFETTRQRHLQHLMGKVPHHMERLRWSRDQLRAERTARLRELVQTARTRSAWHAPRLAGVDLDSLDEDRLRDLPVMTKRDLMTQFDAIVTDPRVTLAQVNAHIDTLVTDAYLLDEFHAVASGGSSGERGVFVWGWDAWTDVFLVGMRNGLAAAARDGATDPPVIAMVAAEKASHMTSAVGQTFSNPMTRAHRFPVTLPVAEIVAGLNEAQPNVVMVYPSMLTTLAAEARAGRLRISPRAIVATAEPLLPEIRELARSTWNVTVMNQWGTSEGGIVAVGCGAGDGMHLIDDLVIVEPVDERGNPVPAGTESAKVYLTTLFNPLLPLIRYEITDRVTPMDEPCPCGSAFRRIADIQGRLDDGFTYGGGIVVHPHVFRSVLGRDSRIQEYQVRQTADGAEVSVVGDATIDTASLQSALEAALVRVGCAAPVVRARRVDAIPRVGIGKLKRFVPLA